MEKFKRKVVVIGGLHHNTLGVVRSLGEEGIKSNNIVVVLTGERIPKENIISKSKYTTEKNMFYLPSDDEIFAWLIKYKNENKEACLICCSDGSAEAVMKNHSILKEFYLLPGLLMDVERLMDKSVQNDLARKVGMLVPENIIVDLEQEFSWDIFPCITKPIKSVEGGGKADIHVINTRDEMNMILPGISAKNIEIQQYIDKEIEYQLIGCSLNSGETIIIPGFTEILRQPPNTNTGYLKYSPIQKLNYNEMAVKDFIREIGYSGLFSIEFIRDKEGTDYFLEINMRNDGNAYCVKSAGVNLPYIWYCSLAGMDVTDVKKSIDKTVYFIPDFIDIKQGIQTVGVFKWIFQFFSAKSHSLYNIRDIKPFLFTFGGYLKIMLGRVTGRIMHK